MFALCVRVPCSYRHQSHTSCQSGGYDHLALFALILFLGSMV